MTIERALVIVILVPLILLLLGALTGGIHAQFGR